MAKEAYSTCLTKGGREPGEPSPWLHPWLHREKKQSRSKRTLIGRVDPETGEIVPTDGRCKKLSPDYQGDSDYQMPKTLKECRAEILRLLEENKSLKEKLLKLQGE